MTPAQALKALLATSGATRVLLAVSGGSDSLSLLKAAASAEFRSRARFAAATVDHGLRPESAKEALWVGERCREAGVEHVILKWTGDKPSNGVQEAARAARYRLLATEAEARGFDAIMTAHTADDQAETVFMRLARGSGPRGLSGMRERSLIAAGAGEPVSLLRPFLDVTREALRADLKSQSWRWIDDPSNDDYRFERVRVRGLLAALEAQSLLTRDALLHTARQARAAAERADAGDVEAFRRLGGLFHHLGFARVPSEGLAPTLVARLIRAVGGEDHAPSEDDAARAAAQAQSTGAATLGGALLKRVGEALYVCREPAAVLGRGGVEAMPRIPVEPHQRIVWDRRFIVENRAEAPLAVEPLGLNLEALVRVAALERCPSEAIAAAPRTTPAGAATAPAPSAVSLINERFDRKVMRFL